jgi:hypothetical protein
MEYMALCKPIVQFDLKEGWLARGRHPCTPAGTTSWPTSPARFSCCTITHRSQKRIGQFGRKRESESLALAIRGAAVLSAYDRAFS